MAKAPAWTGVVIGLLSGLLLGAAWWLGREMNGAPRHAGAAVRDTVVVREVVVPAGETAGEQRENAIVAATRRVAPAVVSINAVQHRVYSRAVVPRGMQYWERFFPGTFPRREFRQDVSSLGSGVIVSPDGYVLTNVHVIEDADELVVTLQDGTQTTAKVLDQVAIWDLALLQIEGHGGPLPYAPIYQGDPPLQIGEWAIAIGSPFGYLLADTRPTVTVGVLSALNRDIKQQQDGQTFLGMIQTDAAINPGNSGGPLINAWGEVIGINTFIFTESGGSIGLGFAVPIERARWIIRDVREFGRYRRPYWGMGIQQLTAPIAQALDLADPHGFLVREITPDAPAWKAGLRVYDVLREIDGVEVRDKDTVDRIIYEAKVGSELKVTYEREGESKECVIVLEEAPDSDRSGGQR
ncbi:MAG TPA: trypsin-like peptidase domain-containing protein [Candidatus Krumholzibacteria bacterium]|nr:trypsin-like peptidase domain-containing protein [Candidatus Krumholzibacteria bacterium]HRX52355.1 trypsin-like peptidase domain-containing protein [Candidatus Krumholzibacteria bacterium]